MSFQNVNARGIIVQTGTDNDLSGLNGITGVTTTIADGRKIYDFGDNKLLVQGTLYHDPENEVLIFRKNVLTFTGTIVTDGATTATVTTTQPHDFVAGDTVYISGTPNIGDKVVVSTPSTTSFTYTVPNGTASPVGTFTIQKYFSLIEVATVDSWSSISSWTTDGDGRLVFTRAGHTYNVGDGVGIKQVTTTTGDTGSINTTHRVYSVTSTTVTLDTFYESSMGTINGNGLDSRRGCYNYGKETTSYGRSRYSSGTGIVFTGGSPTNWSPRDYCIFCQFGYFWSRGGSIELARPYAILAGDLNNTAFVGTRVLNGSTVEARDFGRTKVTNCKFVKAGCSGITLQKDFGAIFNEAAFFETLGSFYEITLRDFDVSANPNPYDIGHSADDRYAHRDWEIINSANGSNVKGLWRDTTGNSGQKGGVVIKKEVFFKFLDTSGNSLSSVKLYLQDNPSAYAKDATFKDPTNVDYTSNPTKLNGILNGDGTITYYYKDPFVYEKISDINGNIDTFKVTTATQILEFNATDSSALIANGGPYAIPSFNTYWRETDNLGPLHTDWDTNRFGGFYKVDRRSDSNTDLDDFTFKFFAYDKIISTASQKLKGTGVLNVEWTLFRDPSISEQNKDVVATYTQIDNSQKFYDRAKLFLYDNYDGEVTTIVTRDGNIINADGYDVDIDKTAVDVFAFDGSKITIKADNYIGQIQTTGTLNLLNGALYNSIPTLLNLNLQDGYISIYDNNGDIKYYTNEDQIITLPLNSTGIWTYKVGKYGFRTTEGSFSINQTTIDISPRYTPDIYVSDTLKNVSAYDTFQNVQQIYDYLSYYSTFSAAMLYPEYYIYGDSVNVLSNNITFDPNFAEAFEYDGSTFTFKSDKIESTLIFDTVKTTGNIYLSGTSTFENLHLESVNVFQNNVVSLTGFNLVGTLVYNTDSSVAIFYTDCNIDKVINDGIGSINITRINSIITDTTDAEITTSVPITINITTPVDAYTAIYKPNGDRLYYGTGNQTLIIGGGDAVTGLWTYTVSKYGFVPVNGTFNMDVDISSTTDIDPSILNVDPLITVSNVSTVQSYNDLNTSLKLYDYVSYFKTTSDGIIYSNATNNATIINRSIGSLVFGKSLTLDSDAVVVLSVVGDTFILKSSGLDEVATVYVDGDLNLLNSSSLSKDVKVRADNLDSEIEFVGVDAITFYPSGLDRDNNTNAGPYLANPSIYRFKYGNVYGTVQFSGTIYGRVQVSGSTILNSIDIVQFNNVLDLGTYGQLQLVLNSQQIINNGIKKASRLIPHSQNI